MNLTNFVILLETQNIAVQNFIIIKKIYIMDDDEFLELLYNQMKHRKLKKKKPNLFSCIFKCFFKSIWFLIKCIIKILTFLIVIFMLFYQPDQIWNMMQYYTLACNLFTKFHSRAFFNLLYLFSQYQKNHHSKQNLRQNK
ncbi:hypothetical protein pb186bvf_015776 [Paramecium bursaria]